MNALFDHYTQQVRQRRYVHRGLQDNIGSGILPAHIRCDAHDIASLFKRYLIKLPGGILGSARVYLALKDIHENLKPDPRFPVQTGFQKQAIMIAICISSITSPYRVKLICAVFGLLALVGRATVKAEDQVGKDVKDPRSELMTYRALGVCFGPALLGDMAEALKQEVAAEDSNLDVLPEEPGSMSHYQVLLDQAQEMAKAHARIVETIILRWKMVSCCLKTMGTIQVEHEAVLMEKKQGLSGELGHRHSGSDLFLRLFEICPSNTTSIRQSVETRAEETANHAEVIEDQVDRRESRSVSHIATSREVNEVENVPAALRDPFEYQSSSRRPAREPFVAEKRRCHDWSIQWDEAAEKRGKAGSDSSILTKENNTGPFPNFNHVVRSFPRPRYVFPDQRPNGSNGMASSRGWTHRYHLGPAAPASLAASSPPPAPSASRAPLAALTAPLSSRARAPAPAVPPASPAPPAPLNRLDQNAGEVQQLVAKVGNQALEEIT